MQPERLSVDVLNASATWQEPRVAFVTTFTMKSGVKIGDVLASMSIKPTQIDTLQRVFTNKFDKDNVASSLLPTAYSKFWAHMGSVNYAFEKFYPPIRVLAMVDIEDRVWSGLVLGSKRRFLAVGGRADLVWRLCSWFRANF